MTPSKRFRSTLTITAVLLVGACGGAGTPSVTTTPQPSSATPSTSPSSLAAVRIHLEEVATLEQPLAMAVRAGDTALYVAQKTGKVLAIRAGRTVDEVPVVDLSDDVSLGSEQGLLGLAFSPGGNELYVNYTDTNGDTHITGFAMEGDRVDPSTRRDILVVDQPYSNHNGGNLVFGPDGNLYIGLGDGGSGGDPQGNGQSLSTLLGKMLRIDPTPFGDRPYRVPTDNPFVGRAGARPEIWAFGLRNPWRYSFDRLTGDLWIGDVGQSAWEEVDIQAAGSPGGENYGWNRIEGDHSYGGADPPAHAVRPAYEYSHDRGCVVTGGYVYRGSAIPDLYGAYVFADFCAGGLEAIRLKDGRVIDRRALGPVVPSISSLGEDTKGELYAMSLGGSLYRLAPGS